MAQPTRLSFCLLAPLLWGCSVGASATAADDANGSSGANGIPTGVGDAVGEIRFLETALQLAPEQDVELHLEVSPPAPTIVRVSLLGDSRDAYLDRADLSTGADGKGAVWLTAPSSSALFSVRASTENGAHTELRVSIGEDFTDVVVVPVYDVQSPRAISEWTATAATGKSCDTYAQIPPPDGDQLAAAPEGTNPTITNVPVGVPLTITVRAGHYAGGCRDLEAAIAGQDNTVDVLVQNRPLQMDNAEFDLRLGIDDDASWRAALLSLVDDLVKESLGGRETDLARVLAVMDTVIEEADGPDVAAQFRLERAANGWDAVAAQALGQSAIDGMRTELRARYAAGLDVLVSDAAVDATFTASPDTPEFGTLVVRRIGGTEAGKAGFPSSLVTTWTPGADEDTVTLGGDLVWSPARLVTALADLLPGPADGVVGSDGKTAVAAAETFGCEALGLALAPDGYVFANYNAPKLTNRCIEAIRVIWASAPSAFEGSGSLAISLAADAHIDDEAVPTGLSGSWVGNGTVNPDTQIDFKGVSEGGREFVP